MNDVYYYLKGNKTKNNTNSEFILIKHSGDKKYYLFAVTHLDNNGGGKVKKLNEEIPFFANHGMLKRQMKYYSAVKRISLEEVFEILL